MTRLLAMLRGTGAHSSRHTDLHLASKYPLKILIVEDMAIAMRVLQSLLRSIGYEPLTAKDGRQAVEVYAEEKPQVVIMDIQMPEMDGIEATVKIREWDAQSGTKRAFITALTADIETDHRPECFTAGMDDYIHKPIQKSHLCELLIAAHQAMA